MQNFDYDIPAIISVIIVFLLLSIFVVLSVLMFQRRRQEHAKELLQLKHDYEQTLLSSQLEIQEETLRNISQEIHDNIGQVLSLAKLQLNTFSLLSMEDGATSVASTKELVSKAITDLRSLSKSLNPDRVNELGLEENIRHELEMLERTRLYCTILQINGNSYQIPAQTQTILFRMVQESISNIIKHAAASRVMINLNYEPEQFSLIIEDNGIGLPATALTAPESGIGLKNMQRRSSVIGATFNILPVTSGGTAVYICVPVS